MGTISINGCRAKNRLERATSPYQDQYDSKTYVIDREVRVRDKALAGAELQI